MRKLVNYAFIAALIGLVAALVVGSTVGIVIAVFVLVGAVTYTVIDLNDNGTLKRLRETNRSDTPEGED